MDHVRPLGHVPGTGEFEFETLRQAEIKLDCRALPASSDGILDVNVDLRTVERARTLRNLIGHIRERQVRQLAPFR